MNLTTAINCSEPKITRQNVMQAQKGCPEKENNGMCDIHVWKALNILFRL